MAKLHDKYQETVVAELTQKFGYTSVMQVPRIEKITLNMGWRSRCRQKSYGTCCP